MATGTQTCYRQGLTASAYVHCDNSLKYYVSSNGGASFTLMGTQDYWGNQVTLQQVVTAQTVYRFECQDISIIGGFIGTVYVNGGTYPTASPVTNYGWQPSTSINVYKGRNAKPWSEYHTLASTISASSNWVWNSQAGNTIVFDFAFEPHLRYTCTSAPTRAPTRAPTLAPTLPPTGAPTLAPTPPPTTSPTAAPTRAPTTAPTPAPTTSPTTAAPTSTPTAPPTPSPTPTPTPSPTPRRGSFTFRTIRPDAAWFPANTTAFLTALRGRLLQLLPSAPASTTAAYFQRMTAAKGSIIVAYDDTEPAASAAVAAAVAAPSGLVFTFAENGTVYTMGTNAPPSTSPGSSSGGSTAVAAGVAVAVLVVVLIAAAAWATRRRRHRGQMLLARDSSPGQTIAMQDNPLFGGLGSAGEKHRADAPAAVSVPAAGYAVPLQPVYTSGSRAGAPPLAGESYAMPLQPAYSAGGGRGGGGDRGTDAAQAAADDYALPLQAVYYADTDAAGYVVSRAEGGDRKRLQAVYQIPMDPAAAPPPQPAAYALPAAYYSSVYGTSESPPPSYDNAQAASDSRPEEEFVGGAPSVVYAVASRADGTVHLYTPDEYVEPRADPGEGGWAESEEEEEEQQEQDLEDGAACAEL